MLQFIVLGIVPGTNIQLNLSDVLRIAAVFLMMYILLSQLSRFKSNPKLTSKFPLFKLLGRKV